MSFSPARTARYYFLKFKRLRGDPQSLAKGAALGMFIGISPTVPLHTVAIIGFSFLFRSSVIAALIVATIVCNPLTLVPIYYICWKIGDFILPDRLTWERIEEVLSILNQEGFVESIRYMSQLSIDGVMVMITGGTLLAILPTLATYYYSLRFFLKIREKRRQKHLLD